MIETNEFNGDVREDLIGSDFDVTNIGSDVAQFYWSLERSADMPDDWEFSICDQILCFPLGQESSDCDDPSFINVLDPGQTINYYKVGLRPNGVAGVHEATYRLTSVCGNFTEADVIATQVITFSVSGGTDVEDVLDIQNDKSVLIYPNPTVDRFQINEDSDISEIAIYNIVGKQIAGDTHYAGKAHDISKLDEGIYLVRMMNSDQEVVKVLRLTKE